MKKDPGKLIRIAQLAKRNTIKKVAKESFVMLLLVVDEKLFEDWLKSTNSFPELLLKIGDEVFGEAEDCDEPWQQKLCEIVTDTAQKYLTQKEWERATLSTPKELMVWFSAFLKQTLSKNELRWDGSLFDAKDIEKRVAEIGIEVEKKSSVEGSYELTTGKKENESLPAP